MMWRSGLLAAGEAEPDDLLLAAPDDAQVHVPACACRCRNDYHRPGAVTQASPECRRRDAVVTDRQRTDPLRRQELRRNSSIASRSAPPTTSITNVRCAARLCRSGGPSPGPRAPAPAGCGRSSAGPHAPVSGPRCSRCARARRCRQAFRQRGRGDWHQDRPQETSRPRAVVSIDDLQAPRMVRLQRCRQLVDQARLLPISAAGQSSVERLELLGRQPSSAARRAGAAVDPCAESRPAPARRGTNALFATLCRIDPGPIQRLAIDGMDHDAMVEQEIKPPGPRPLDRRPQLDPRARPLVQLAARLARSACPPCAAPSARDRPSSLLIHDPRRMCALICPVDP